MKKRFLIFSSSLIFFFGLSVVLDRIVGLFMPSAGLIFPQSARHEFRTPEFSYTVETNSLGFRDREFDLHKTAKIRILAIGDSFTYGWGVEASQSWPKVLEAKLRASGRDVEIANLGKPGGSPRDYADIAEKATPVLKPDLLVIAVLQGDDLAQLAESRQSTSNDENKKKADATSVRHQLQATAIWLYPHFLALMNDRIKREPTLADQWKEDARTLLAMMTPENKAQLEKLDAHVREAFLNGELNPPLIYGSVTQPEYFLQTLDVDSPKVKLLVLEMANQLVRIKDVADRNKAKVIVVSVPYGVYVSLSSFKSRRRVGFSVVPELLTTNAQDEAIRNASQMAGVPFYDVTRDFRQASVDTDFFFELDGHFNSAGHRHFAEALIPIIEKMVTAADTK